MQILVLNAGSSSQKSCLYEVGETLPDRPSAPLWEGQLSWQPSGAVTLKVKTDQGKIAQEEDLGVQSQAQALEQLLQTLWQGETAIIDRPQAIDWVGHRVVHGGRDYQQPTRITPAVKAAISRLAVLAPAHNPVNLEGITLIEELLGAVPQAAVFDTSFHAQLPLAAAIYPGPYQWFEQGIRRYGFHGISHEYCAQQSAQLLGLPLQELRLITCHLGNGCSLAAIAHGHSIDTTMGFTPLEGLMMGSRSGSVDPGILLYLIREQGYSADQLDQLLNQESGLLGISGISNDLRQIQAAIAAGEERARLAFEIYIHRLRSQLGAMLAALRGDLDALVFTGGVGEHQPPVRAAACEAFEFLGLELDPDKNAQSPVDQDIATPESAVRVLVVEAQEDWAIAQACWHLAQSSGVET